MVIQEIESQFVRDSLLGVDENGEVYARCKNFTIIDFYGRTCTPCKVMLKVLEEFQIEMEDITFYKLDIQQDPELAVDLRVITLPTLLLLEEGKTPQSLVGLISKQQLRDELASFRREDE